ncbi:hypothetical protein NE865_08997 [Phthorimaea operculella]|nr:hypothetical protein NE865_14596 [Phthorimaea operculella]KAI5638363.1 hypothetical protein NE865_08997 [Phthorimaea operculella]
MIGKTIDHQAKQVAYNVYSYYKKRKQDKSTLEHKNDINLIDIVSEVTGLSKSSVIRIVRDGNAMKAEGRKVFFEPMAKKKHVRSKRILIDELTEGVIRRKVIQFYTEKNEVPSIRKLNDLLKKENILNCSDEYLRQLLHKLGFTNSETDSGVMLRERADIVSQRLNYLEAMKSFRKKGKSIFFFNETQRWIQQDIDGKTKSLPEGMPNYVIVHGSGATGFADGALLMMYTVMTQNGSELSQAYDWVKDIVLPNMPPQSVIVMNMPFYEKPESTNQEPPSMASTRANIEDWLNRHSIPFKETALKSTLFQLVKTELEKMEFNIGTLITKNNHEVLYLPKNHSDLNPAALMWKEVKEFAETSAPDLLIRCYPNAKWIEKFQLARQNEEEYFLHDIKVDDEDHIKQLKREPEEDEADMNLKPKTEPEEESDENDDSMNCEYDDEQI